jgi:hypothetical protein
MPKVKQFYETEAGIIYIYKKRHRTLAWHWKIYIDGKLAATGRDNLLYTAKYQSLNKLRGLSE